MLKAVLCCAFAACLGLVPIGASAQQVVHALTGTVSSIDSVGKTISVFQDNGAQRQFSDKTDSKARFALDKKVTLDTTAADAFKKTGAYVIVFYYGDNEDRTAVALKNLGAGPFTSTTGTVVRFDGKRSISVEDPAGVTQTYKITPETIAEGYMGAMEGFKFQVQKGDKVRVVATGENNTATALFLRQM